jgi:RNA polymerase-interacting CarD/CdnL/TRCF family regulator
MAKRAPRTKKPATLAKDRPQQNLRLMLHSRLIDAAAVVAEMLRMKKEMDASDARARALGLAEEEFMGQARAMYADWPLVA